MFNYWLYCMKNAFNFSGRARRSEFWFFRLMNVIVLIAFILLLATFSYGMFSSISEQSADSGSPAQGFAIVSLIVSTLFCIWIIWTFFASLAVTVRRMHDTNHSGWYMLIPIYSFILAVTEGTRGDNYYGQDPKGATDSSPKDTEILDA